MRFAVIAHRSTETNLALAAAGGGAIVSPRDALLSLAPGDVALGRLDVLESLEGVEPGLEALERLESAGVTVLNRPRALLAAHDRLLTARALRLAGLPHPWTALVTPTADVPRGLPYPVVLEPRFARPGRDAVVCRDYDALQSAVERASSRSWFARDGAIVQEFLPVRGRDLHVIVAAGRVVRSRDVEPPSSVCALAEKAAATLAADLVGVDLLPDRDRHVILQLDAGVELRSDIAHVAATALLGRVGMTVAA